MQPDDVRDRWYRERSNRKQALDAAIGWVTGMPVGSL